MINVEMKFCLTYAETELLKENMAKANRGQVDIFPIMTFTIFPFQTLLLLDLLYIFA